jgi:hypothetical protein
MRNRRLVLACFVVVVLGVVSYIKLCPSEPSFRGQPLSAWLRKLGHLYVGTSIRLNWDSADLNQTSVNAEAADAIRHIGSDRFPYLLYAITNKEPALKRKIVGFLPGRLQNLIPPANLAEPRGEAVLAFAVLGKQAESVTPELAKALYEAESCKAAALALSAIGPKGWTVLTQAIGAGTSTNENAAYCAVWALGGQRAAVQGTLETLESAVTNRTATAAIADEACWALGRIGQDKEHVVPFLITAVESPGKQAVNWYAIIGLGEFGTNATSAVPLLLQARQSQENSVGISALTALRKIDPKGAAQGLYRFVDERDSKQAAPANIKK